MTLRIEWRCRDEADDKILVLDEQRGVVLRVVNGDQASLRDYLNDMAALRLDRDGLSQEEARRDPGVWGDLVMARATTGEVLDMDPELYWNSISRLFRSRGVDPHALPR